MTHRHCEVPADLPAEEAECQIGFLVDNRAPFDPGHLPMAAT